MSLFNDNDDFTPEANNLIRRSDKKVWNVEKNYAPVRKGLEVDKFTAEKYSKRKAAKAAVHEKQQSNELDMRTQANQAMAVSYACNVRRNQKKQAYANRVAQRSERYETYVSKPQGISPWLSFSDHQGTSVEDRIRYYNRRHSCSHGFKYTDYIQHNNVLKNMTAVPSYLEVICHCTTEKHTGNFEEFACLVCGATRTERMSDVTIDATVRYCNLCKNKMYTRFEHTHTLRPRTFEASAKKFTAVEQAAPPTERRWAALPPQDVAMANIPTEEVKPRQYVRRIPMANSRAMNDLITTRVHQGQKEVGADAIKEQVMSFAKQILGIGKTIKTWLARRLWHVAKDALLHKFWDNIIEAAQIIISGWKLIPVTTIYTIYNFLTTDSLLERGVLLYMLSCEGVLAPFIKKIRDSLAVYAPETLDFLATKEKKRMYEKTTKTSVVYIAPDKCTMHQDIAEPDGTVTEKKVDVKKDGLIKSIFRGKKESGLPHFIVEIFHLRKLVKTPGLILDLVKHFNTMMTGWKNVHELINNFLGHLPNWMTKFFQYTDPKKRYASEAMGENNPIADMKKAYMNFLVGENSASASAFDDFNKKWKDAEHYINVEFTPNEVVSRMHRQFKNNIAACMSPGTLGARTIPYVITIFGKPGVGKSTTWPLLVSGITGGTLRQIRGMSYTRNSASEYFDGYNPDKHKIFVYDDFGAQVDDECAGELMSIVSNADYLPPYASLNDPNVGVKGTSFNSPLVVLCSNFEDFSHCKQIADKIALKRRLGIVIEVAGKWNKDIRYTVKRVHPTGEFEKLRPSLDHETFNTKQLQEFLGADYEKHMRMQNDVLDSLEEHRYVKPVHNFLDLYNAAMPTTKGEEARVQQATASLTPFSVNLFGTKEAGGTDDLDKISSVEKTLAFKEAEARMDHACAQLEATQSKNPFGDEDEITEEEQEWTRVHKARVIIATDLIAFLRTWIGAGVTLLWLISATVCLASTIYLVYKLIGAMLGKKVEESGETMTPKAAAKPIFSRATGTKELGEQEENTLRKILRNQFIIRNENRQFVNGLFVKGRIMLTVKHFVQLSNIFELCSERAGDEVIYTVDKKDCDIIEMKDVDLALIAFPEHIQVFADITKSFAEQPLTRNCMGYTSRRDPITKQLTIYGCPVNRGRQMVQFDHGIVFCDFSYRHDHRQGDCGNIITVAEGGSQKIIGIHESGDKTDKELSFACMVNKMELLGYIAQFNWKMRISREDSFPYENVQLEHGEAPNKCQLVGYCDRHVTGSTDTALRPSTIHDGIQLHTTMPALLHRKGGLDPMRTGLYKYGKATKQFPIEPMEMAIDSIIEELRAVRGPEDRAYVLTLDEALNGIPGEVESVDASTSSGYPFSLDPKLRGAKNKVLIRDETLGIQGKWKLGDAAEMSYNRWTELLANGIVPTDPFLATLKDERRKIEKVQAGKTRLFCAGSLSSFLHNKQQFAAFAAFFKRTRAKTFSTLGLDRASQEWDKMIKWMMEVGDDCGLDGDEEDWDGRFKASIAFAALRIFDDFYENISMKRYALFCHAIFALIRVSWNFGEGMTTAIMQVPGLMPSGWWLTLILNSIVNATMMRIAWIMLVSKPYNDLYYFRKNVRDKYTGDDSFLNVFKAFSHEFNNITIAKLFLEYDQIYTPAAKNGELVPYKRTVDCLFMKLTTGRLYDRWVALFDMEANLEITNWIRKCDNEHEATNDNCNDVLRNLFFYGQKTFDSYRAKMLELDPTLCLITYQPLAHAYLGYGTLPDPYGTFGFTRTAVRDPAALYRAVQNLKPNIGTKEMGLDKPTMHRVIYKEQKDGSMKYVVEKKTLADLRQTVADIMEEQEDLACKLGQTLRAIEILEAEEATSDPRLASQPTALSQEARIKCLVNEIRMQERSVQSLLEGVTERLEEIEGKGVSILTIGQHKKRVEEVEAMQEKLSRKVMNLDNKRAELFRLDPTWRSKLREGRKEAGDGLTTEQPVASRATAPAATQGNPSGLDESDPVVTTKVGVHLAEQQETVVLKPVDGNARSSMSRATAHLNETDWNLEKMLLRENLVGAFAWSLTDPVGSELTVLGTPPLDVPTDLLQNSIVSAPFQRFQFWRCDKIKVRFQLVASRFHQGRLLIYFLPSMLAKANVSAPAAIYGPTRATQLQHCFLDPANGTVVDFEIPFRYNKGWIDLIFGDVLGQLHVQVLNGLQAATGASTSVEVKVFVSFEGSSFRVPRPGGESFRSQLAKEAESMGYTLVKKGAKEAGLFRKVGNGVGGALDDLVESIVPAEITGAVAGILLDKPAVTEYPEPLVHKDAQYMSASRGVENLERMTLEPTAQYLTDDQFGDRIDETDHMYLLKKPVFYKTFNWPATATVGTILFQNIISPRHLLTANPIVLETAFDPTIMGFMSNLFTKWRGTINFHVQVVGTAFHEGRLDFCNHPGTITVPTDYATAMSQYVNSQTIRNTNNTVEVGVPFHSDTPYKLIWNGETLSDMPTDNSVRAMDYCTGCFSIRVAVPLKSPNNVANNVDVNVFISAGEDFHFHEETVWSGIYETTETVARREKIMKARAKNANVLQLRRAVKEAGDLNTDTRDDSGIIPLGVGHAYTYDPPVHHFGETYSNLRECAKRYSLVRAKPFPVTPLASGNNIDHFVLFGIDMGGMLGILFQSYRLFRGPMNWKFQVYVNALSSTNIYLNNLTGWITYSPQPALFSSGNPATAAGSIGFGNAGYPKQLDNHNIPLVRFSGTQVAEFQTPYQSHYHSLLNSQPFDNTSEYFGNMFTEFDLIYNLWEPDTVTTAKRAQCTLSAALGDETRFGVFMGFPQLILPSANPPYPNPGS